MTPRGGTFARALAGVVAGGLAVVAAPARALAQDGGSAATGGAGGAGAEGAAGASAEAQAGGARPPAIDVAVGLRGFSRSLSYTDDLFDELNPYDLPLAPAFAASVEYYPGAALADGPAGWFGVAASFEQAFALSSQRRDGSRFTTNAYSASIGARARVPLGRHEAGLLVGWGTQAFTVGNAEATRAGAAVSPGVVDVAYAFLRVGASGRVALGERVAVTAGFAYLAVFDAGEMTRAPYFPRASVGGIEASAGVAVPLGAGVEARAGVDLRRYFYTLNPQPGDRYVAGGAVDQYLVGTLALAYRR